MLALAASLPAQAKFLNATIPAEVIVTLVDWKGQPALMLLAPKSIPLVIFKAPGYYVGQKVELQVMQFAALDYRPCAATSLIGLLDRDTSEPRLPMIAGAPLIVAPGVVGPAILNDVPNGWQPADPRLWGAQYCGQACHTTCGTWPYNGEGPQFAAVIVVPVLR